ncbi:hypothetical protein CC85DRAFT_198501 [Cutaneotrichosporon oleaginosum]|uniref:Uncharacterized protein n=1 Tax=Cutaneotrichosporon oleaginosum TaxID=879819 RepID=A0A0J1AVH3_9TREE|nr:uncharacterized protein CC85DRAFT_198501 [Cutaneotrichosporon oleaginosum]KLT39289.1 hypothetical protein CC85DRAFT_198501 [Cutaneotrichosporon oleaginosum]TXT08547.1 hypothetical protein COLE_05471 [Cutaneotrichosporon oleaginosum]
MLLSASAISLVAYFQVPTHCAAVRPGTLPSKLVLEAPPLRAMLRRLTSSSPVHGRGFAFPFLVFLGLWSSSLSDGERSRLTLWRLDWVAAEPGMGDGFRNLVRRGRKPIRWDGG